MKLTKLDLRNSLGFHGGPVSPISISLLLLISSAEVQPFSLGAGGFPVRSISSRLSLVVLGNVSNQLSFSRWGYEGIDGLVQLPWCSISLFSLLC